MAVLHEKRRTYWLFQRLLASEYFFAIVFFISLNNERFPWHCWSSDADSVSCSQRADLRYFTTFCMSSSERNTMLEILILRFAPEELSEGPEACSLVLKQCIRLQTRRGMCKILLAAVWYPVYIRFHFSYFFNLLWRVFGVRQQKWYVLFKNAVTA